MVRYTSLPIQISITLANPPHPPNSFACIYQKSFSATSDHFPVSYLKLCKFDNGVEAETLDIVGDIALEI